MKIMKRLLSAYICALSIAPLYAMEQTKQRIEPIAGAQRSEFGTMKQTEPIADLPAGAVQNVPGLGGSKMQTRKTSLPPCYRQNRLSQSLPHKKLIMQPNKSRRLLSLKRWVGI